MNRDQSEVHLGGQVPFVTGGGRGLGRAFAEALAAAGAAAAAVARSAGQVEESSVQDVEQHLGPVDLLVNNAGVSGPIGPIDETDPEQWWRCLEINLRGPSGKRPSSSLPASTNFHDRRLPAIPPSRYNEGKGDLLVVGRTNGRMLMRGWSSYF